MKAWHIAIVLAGVAASACRASDEQRRTVLESAERTNAAIVRGSVVRDMRAPPDTGRVIYEPPVDLSHRTAPAAGARQVWAPFGIAQPDTVAHRPPR